MPTYMALLWESPTAAADISPEEMQQIIQKYRDWMAGLEQAGRYLGGQKLKDDHGKVLRSPQGQGQLRILDGPYSETKEILGGYFAFTASDYDDAVRVTRDCPHLGYGGSIELREVDEV